MTFSNLRNVTVKNCVDNVYSDFLGNICNSRRATIALELHRSSDDDCSLYDVKMVCAFLAACVGECASACVCVKVVVFMHECNCVLENYCMSACAHVFYYKVTFVLIAS